MVLRTTKNWDTLCSYFDSLNISIEKYIESYWKLLRNFLSASSIVMSW